MSGQPPQGSWTGPDTTVAREAALGDERIEKPSSPTGRGRGWLRVDLRSVASSLVVPVLSVVTALIIGGFVIVLSDPDFWAMLQSDPIGAIVKGLQDVIASYQALLTGSIGSPTEMISALASGDPKEITAAFQPISETLLSATPLIFTGLAVAVGFRAGLFNIGAEGQLYIGAIFAVYVGFSFTGLPMFIHLPLAIAAGILGGAIWGFVPGILKAKTGAHEVIVTIMMNYISYQVVMLVLKTEGFQRPGRDDPISQNVLPSATLPPLIDGLRVHWGFILALVAAAVVSWLLFRSTTGFEFRAVGLNPGAARYAGMNISRTIVLAMVISGGLAGLAGTVEMLGTSGKLTPGFSPGYGFDAIAIALIGGSRPSGVVAAAILFGALRAGATPMQAATGTPIDLVVVIQALVIMFVAAPALVRAIWRIKSGRATGTEVFSKGWGA
ncbi:MAG: ABC transporter permease [Chloroflexi bacterium]|nr:ABC transporter permease [Chloroflexota bacterium]